METKRLGVARLPAPWTAITRRLPDLLRRVPFSIGLMLVMLAAGAIGGSMFRPIEDDPNLLRRVGYGVDALRDGRLWTLVTSALFTWQPWMLQTIALSILLFVVPLELVAGTRRTAVAFFVGHLTGYLLASLLVAWPLAALGVGWGKELDAAIDVGASAGAFGCAAALTWFLPRSLTRPAQVGLAVYLGFWLLSTERIWDVEHAIAAVAGFVLGHVWTRGETRTMHTRSLRLPAFDRRSIRLALAIAVAVVGLVNLASALLAGVGGTVPTWATHLPGGLLDNSRSFVVLAGFLLILLGRGLALGRRLAWLGAVVLLEGSAVAHLLKGLDVQEAVVASVAAVALATQNDLFRARPDAPSLTRAARTVGALLAGFLVYGFVGLVLFRDQVSPPMDTLEASGEFFARLVFLSTDRFRGDTALARWFLESLSLVWSGLVIYAVVALLRPRLRPFAATGDDRADAVALLRAHGRTTTSPMTLWPGNTLVLSDDRCAFLAYRLIGDVALVLGDPTGPADALPAMIDEFLGRCETAGWTPCFYAVTPPALDLFTRRGMATIQVGEDAIVPLATLEFKGKRWQDVRSAINKANREGVRFAWFDQATGDRAIRDQLWDISNAWLAEKGLPEMGFTLGQLTDPPDPDVRTAVALDATGRVHAFVTWLPVYAERGWVIDLMRRRPDAVRGVMEFLIAESATSFRADGDRMFSLAAAPLAHVERPGEDVTSLQRGLDVVAERLEPFYHFAPLFEFKRKFDPAWSPIYVVYPNLASLPKVSVAIVRAYLPKMGVQEVAAQLSTAAATLPRRWRPAPRDNGEETAPASAVTTNAQPAPKVEAEAAH